MLIFGMFFHLIKFICFCVKIWNQVEPYLPQQRRFLRHFLEQPFVHRVLYSLFCFGSILLDLVYFLVDRERKSIFDQSKMITFGIDYGNVGMKVWWVRSVLMTVAGTSLYWWQVWDDEDFFNIEPSYWKKTNILILPSESQNCQHHIVTNITYPPVWSHDKASTVSATQ